MIDAHLPTYYTLIQRLLGSSFGTHLLGLCTNVKMSSAGGGQAGYGYGNSHGQGSGFGIRSNTDASGNSRLRDALRSLDHHSSVSAEFRVRTSSGGGFSVLTVLVIAYLLRVEYTYNLLRTTVRDHVHVNATSPAGLDLEFDLTFPFLPCALLSVDAHDPTGQSQSLHLDRTHHVWKHRLSSGGQPIGKKSKYELGSTLYEEDHFRGVAESLGLQILEGEALEAKRRADARYAEIDYGDEGEEEEECGDCYGAGKDGECCPTCDDVKRAYQRRGWHVDLKTIHQCRFVKHARDEEGEGCNIHAHIALSTGGGNFHIAPSRDLDRMGGKEERDSMFVSLIELIEEQMENFDVSHTINRLRFGDDFPGSVNQLDKQKRTLDSNQQHSMHQYYLQVVPTEYRYLNGTVVRTNQYSVTEHTRNVSPGSNRGLPGVSESPHDAMHKSAFPSDRSPLMLHFLCPHSSI